MIVQKDRHVLLLIILVFVIFLYDLGNPDAIRQGTEGFYLNVSKETFKSSNLFTPILHSMPHWSKPPLLYLLPFPFYHLSSAGNLFAARFTILCLSFLLAFFTVELFAKIKESISKWSLFLLIISTLGFIKYSRIFMNESLLMFLPALSSLSLFIWLYRDNRLKFLLLSILFASLGNLSKGPISLFGQMFPLFIFLLFFNKKNTLKTFLYFFVPTLLISSIWYLQQWYSHGVDFLNYFFLRENVGKFTSKGYPVYVVFLGFTTFTMPWLFTFLNRNNLRSFIENFRSKELFIIYLFFHFAFLLILWSLPSQRSHHYAIPSLLFGLLLSFEFLIKNTQYNFNLEKIFIGLESFIVLVATLSIFILFKSIKTQTILFFIFYIVLFFTIIKTNKFPKIIKIATLHIFLISSIWTYIGPEIYLPLIPKNSANIIQSYQQIFVCFRKPYYIEEVLSRSVKAIDPDIIGITLENNKESVLLVLESNLQNIDQNKYKIIDSWQIWMRGVSLKSALKALGQKDLNILKESMLLIQAS